MNTDMAMRERILDTALHLAGQSSWEQLRLHQVADALSLSLDELYRHFAQKDDLVEAWFDRADCAMLQAAEQLAGENLSEMGRLQRIIWSWYQALQPHRRLTRQMLGYKLELGHVHLQVLGLLRVSRTVQWFREAARLSAEGPRRIVQEVAITSVYLICFGRFLLDTSPGSKASARLLARLLQKVPALSGRSSADIPARDRPEAGKPPG